MSITRLSLLSLLLLALVCASIPASVEAQTLYEHIDSFRSDVYLKKNGPAVIRETIQYDFGSEEKHGIYRDLLTRPAPGVDAPITYGGFSTRDLEGGYYPYVVTDSDEGPEEYQTPLKEFLAGPLIPGNYFSGSAKTSVRIGDPDVTITGKHTYVITYNATNIIGQFDDRDEFFWNATGNEWKVPINNVEVHVYVPGKHSLDDLKLANYCGRSGQKKACATPTVTYSPEYDDTEVAFIGSGGLKAHEGITVAVGFPKGVIPDLPPMEKHTVFTFLFDTWFYFAPLFVLLIVFQKRVPFFFRRRKFLQTHTVIAEYDTKISPLEAATLVTGNPRDKDLSAELIWLAVHGYLIIKKEGIEYTFTGTGKDASGLEAYAKHLLEGVSGKSSSDLTNSFYVTARKLKKEILLRLSERGYLLGKPSAIQTSVDGRGLLFLGVFLAINPGLFVWALLGPRLGFIFSTSSLLIGVIATFFGGFRQILTTTGLEAERGLLGLKEYIGVAEKERIKFLNPPAKTPEVFERLLPYAMIFGLEKKWANEFKDIYTEPPSWYQSDANLTAFSVSSFASDMGSFSTSTTSALISTPRASSGSGGGWSSGSSGGGSSGGGGGGGGGGSW